MMLHDLEEESPNQLHFSDASQPNSTGDDSIHQIRYTIDEMFHQVTHLVRSQGELMEVIQENPDDVDFSEAFWENNEVIKTKKKRIQNLLAKIWDRDPVYFRKVDKLLQDLLPDTPPEEEKSDVQTEDLVLDSNQCTNNAQPNSGSNSEPLPSNSSNSEENGLYL